MIGIKYAKNKSIKVYKGKILRHVPVLTNFVVIPSKVVGSFIRKFCVALCILFKNMKKYDETPPTKKNLCNVRWCSGCWNTLFKMAESVSV